MVWHNVKLDWPLWPVSVEKLIFLFLDSSMVSLCCKASVTHSLHHDSSRLELDGKIGMEKKKIQHQYGVSMLLCLQDSIMYGSTTTHDCSATIHPFGATIVL